MARNVEAICAILLVMITGGYTVVAYLTLRSIQSQTTAAIKAADAAKSAADTAAQTLQQQKSQTTSNEADFRKQFNFSEATFSKQLSRLNASIQSANRLASATEQSLAISRKSLAISRENFAEEERPYVFGSSPGIYASGGNEYSGTIYWQNNGRSPAVRVVFNAWYFTGSNALELAYQYFGVIDRRTVMSRQIMPPAAGAVPPTAVSSLVIGPLSPAQMQDFGRDAAIVLVGRVRYFDVHGRAYRTDFCLVRHPNSSLSYCKDHNEMR